MRRVGRTSGEILLTLHFLPALFEQPSLADDYGLSLGENWGDCGGEGGGEGRLCGERGRLCGPHRCWSLVAKAMTFILDGMKNNPKIKRVSR